MLRGRQFYRLQSAGVCTYKGSGTTFAACAGGCHHSPCHIAMTAFLDIHSSAENTTFLLLFRGRARAVAHVVQGEGCSSGTWCVKPSASGGCLTVPRWHLTAL